MNEIHRRTALSALGLAGIAAAAKAGPLNPPAGTVAPTGRTNDEIYNKIAPPGGSDGRIPIAGGSTPITINSRGSYVLTGDISIPSANNVIAITVGNVEIDLNGYSISGPSVAGCNGISIAGGIRNVRIRNGLISGCNTGVNLENGSLGALLEDLTIDRPRQFGIQASAVTARPLICRRCTITEVGGGTTASDGNLNITAIEARHVIATDCVVAGFAYNGTGVGTFSGISVGGPSGQSSVVTGCTVTHNNLTPNTTLTGRGIFMIGSTVGTYRNNTVTGMATPYTGGTDGGGNV